MKKNRLSSTPKAITTPQLFAWSTAGFSGAMQSVIIGFLTIYCSTILGLSPALVGTLLLATKILDCFTDLFIGYLIDNTNTKLGRGRPYDLSILGTWICTILLFSCPPGWTTVTKSIWVVLIYTVMNSGFISLFYSAGTPYMVRAFNNNDAYVKINAIGGLIAMVGGMIVNIVFPQLMETMASTAAGWRMMILIFALPGMAIGVIRFFTIKEKYSLDIQTEHASIKDILQVLKVNRHIFYIGFMLLVYQMVANMGVNTYYFTYVVKDIGMMSLLSITSVMFIPVMFIFPPLLKKVSIDRVILWGMLACCVGCVINWFALDNIVLIFIATAFKGIGVVPLSMMYGLMVIDCADFNEWKGLPRMEATLGIIPGLAGNVGNALGSFVLGICLSLSGFITTVEGEIVSQPDSAVLMVRLLASFIPLVFYALAALSMKQYKLSKMMPQIHQDLEVHRAALAQEMAAEAKS